MGIASGWCALVGKCVRKRGINYSYQGFKPGPLVPLELPAGQNVEFSQKHFFLNNLFSPKDEKFIPAPETDSKGSKSFEKS